MSERAPYAKAFFDLRLEFAERVTRLTGLSLERAVLQYTNAISALASAETSIPSIPAGASTRPAYETPRTAASGPIAGT